MCYWGNFISQIESQEKAFVNFFFYFFLNISKNSIHEHINLINSCPKVGNRHPYNVPKDMKLINSRSKGW